MPFFGSGKAQSFTLSIALKSSSVDVQLVSTSPEDVKKTVLFAQRKIILLKNSQDPQAYTNQCLSELSSILKSSLKSIHDLTGGKLKSAHVVLYAPWFTSKITPIDHKESITVTERFIMDQIKTIKPQKNLVTLEKKVIKILTNGYALTQFTHSKFKNVHIDVYSSYISKVIHTKISEAIKGAVPTIRAVSFSTSPMMIFKQITSFLVREDNVTFIHVGGEITEVGVIEDDSLSFYSTFPIGKHDFMREIQSTIQTYDYDLLYQKQVSIKSPQKQKNFEVLKTQWADMILRTLQSYKTHVPSKLLIMSDSKTRDFFTEALVAHIKNGPEGFLTQHRIINFDISLLKDIISYKTPTLAQELDLQLEALTKN